jgi:hypothetical protein
MRGKLECILVAVLATAATSAAHASTSNPCRAGLPRGPHVPGAIVFTSSCGMFRLETSGAVSRLPRHWFASHGGGTGRRYGADLMLRRNRAGSVFLLRGRRVMWRSSGLYPNDGGSVAFGPGLFAFATYRGGVYLTDLRSPERLVVRGRGTYPLDFTRPGGLIVVNRHTIELVSRGGKSVRRHDFDPARGLSLDPSSDTLYFVTPRDVLMTLVGTRTHRIASVARLAGGFSLANPGLLTWGSGRSITVTTRDTKVVASARWPAKLGTPDLGVSTSADGTLFAFRVSDASPGKRHAASRVFILRRGEQKAHEIFRHRYAQVGCGVLGSLGWHGHDLLYAWGLGEASIFDADANAKPLTFGRFARRLPHQGPHDLPSARWASDYVS